VFMREKIFATRCASLIGNWQTTTPRQQLSQEEVTAMLGKIGGEVNCADQTCTAERGAAMTRRSTMVYQWTSCISILHLF
jgi:hypothetical protein